MAQTSVFKTSNGKSACKVMHFSARREIHGSTADCIEQQDHKFMQPNNQLVDKVVISKSQQKIRVSNAFSH